MKYSPNTGEAFSTPLPPGVLSDRGSLKRLWLQARRRVVDTGEVLSPMGEPLIAYVERGWFKTVRFTALGDEHLLGIRRKGSYLGLECLARAQMAPEVVAMTPGELLIWPFELVQRLVSQELEITRTFLFLLAAQVEEENNLQFLHHSTRVLPRLARLLYLYALEEGHPVGSDLHVNIPFTQTDLALLLGVRRETVSLSLGELELEGVIERCGRELRIKAKPMSQYLNREGAIYGCPELQPRFAEAS